MSYLCPDKTLASWKKSILTLRTKPVSNITRNTAITTSTARPVTATKGMSTTMTTPATATTAIIIMTTTVITTIMAAGSIGLPK